MKKKDNCLELLFMGLIVPAMFTIAWSIGFEQAFVFYVVFALNAFAYRFNR